MDDDEDISDYEGTVAEVVGDWASQVVGEPLVAPNFAVVVDGRMVSGGWVTVLLQPSGSPDWLIQSLIGSGLQIAEEGIGFLGVSSSQQGGDEDE